MRIVRVLAVLAPLVVGALAVSAGCDDTPTPHACSDIPPGGCPLSHGVACEDPSCEATYLCRAGNVWELSQRCPPHDAAPRPVILSDAALSDGAPPSPHPIDASIDAPAGAYGGPGCASLEAPDCALGVALACGTDCCGCEDLYVCEAHGWTLWGACSSTGPRQGP